jgi:cell division protein FtsB
VSAPRRGPRSRPARRLSAPPPPPAAPRRRAALTRRAAILAVTVVSVLVALVVPVRVFLHQRATIRAVAAQVRAQRTEVAALRRELADLHNPLYIEQLARDRLHYVLPGEVDTIVYGPVPGTAAAARSHAGTTSLAVPWYTALWRSVQPAPSHRR